MRLHHLRASREQILRLQLRDSPCRHTGQTNICIHPVGDKFPCEDILPAQTCPL